MIAHELSNRMEIKKTGDKLMVEIEFFLIPLILQY